MVSVKERNSRIESSTKSSKGAYHLSELAGRTGPSLNGTHEFCELRELALAKLALLRKLSRSVLSALRGTREVCNQICDGKCLVSPGPRQSQLSIFFVQWAAYQMYIYSLGANKLVSSSNVVDVIRKWLLKPSH